MLSVRKSSCRPTVERLRDGGEDAAHGCGRLGRPGRAGQQGGEGAAAEVRERVLGAPGVLEAPAELLEKPVRVLGSEAGVQGVEAVDVEDGDREGQAAALGVLDRLAGALLEERRVGEAGHRVVEPSADRRRVAALGLLVHAFLARPGVSDYSAQVRPGGGSLRSRGPLVLRRPAEARE